MHWRLFATLAETAGDTEVAVESGAETVGDAFDALLDAYPDLESEVLDEEGDLYDHVRLLKNGESVFTAGDGLAEPVDPDDELALMPAVSGG